jgi:micrococcal nuclease
MKEVIYNLLLLIGVLAAVGLPLGMIKPKWFQKVLRSKANRKNIAIYSVAIFFVSVTVAGIIEPAHVKQARETRESQAKIAQQEAANNLKLQEEEEKKNAEEQARAAEELAQVKAAQDAAISPEEQARRDKETRRNYWHKVTAIIDGDTVKALVDSKEESIRIYGIDAPELSGECYAAESRSKAAEFLGGKWIQLEEDESQDNRDKYGRLLRYIWFDSGTDFGRRMIEEGYAFEYTYQTQYHKQTQYKETEAYSKSKQFGLWSTNTCSGQKIAPVKEAPRPAPAPAATYTAPKPAPAQTSSGVVKKSSTGICHAPGTTYYDRTTNYTPYSTLDACLQSGGRLPLR